MLILTRQAAGSELNRSRILVLASLSPEKLRSTSTDGRPLDLPVGSLSLRYLLETDMRPQIIFVCILLPHVSYRRSSRNLSISAQLPDGRFVIQQCGFICLRS
jgi:hypothetical protein